MAMYNYPTNGMYGQPIPTIPQQPINNYGIKGRPVSSIEEVRAAQIDFDGSLFVFPDVANKRIYTKQINIDGSASMNMYELTALPSSAPTVNQDYITREEFEAAINALKDAASLTSIPQTSQTAPSSQF